jgi:purine-nucleoside phosphorylase
LSAAYKAARAQRHPTHVGGIYSSDTFYDERPDLWKNSPATTASGVEMEAAELYTLAARHHRRALAVLTNL